MAIDLTTFETNLTTKINSTTGTTDGKEFLLLSKAIEAVRPSIVVSDILSEGQNQISLITTEGSDQVSNVAAEGTTRLSAITAEGTAQVQAVTTEGETSRRSSSGRRRLCPEKCKSVRPHRSRSSAGGYRRSFTRQNIFHRKHVMASLYKKGNT